MRHVDDVVPDSEPEREQRRRRADVTDDQSDTVLELSRFAYSTSSRPPGLGPSPRATLVKRPQQDNLQNSQLAQLSKCVGCGLGWTSRKTVKQKRTHVEQCAKKHALTEDTIRILVEKEIATPSAAQNTMHSRTDPNETSLMDSVIPAGPAKKSKRQQVLPTVKSLPETRDSILNRAKEILGLTDGQAVPQPTQQFGESALARRNTRHSKRPGLLDVRRSTEEPPSTQPFAASSLHARTIPAKQVNGCEESPSLQFSTSLFAQDSVLSSNRHKRPASPPPPASGNSRSMRRRLLQ